MIKIVDGDDDDESVKSKPGDNSTALVVQGVNAVSALKTEVGVFCLQTVVQ